MGKGQDFERTICKELSLWYSQGEREDVFWRTAGSGARATTRAKIGKITANSAGDIGYLDSFGKPFCDYFMIEVKSGYTKRKRINYKKLAESTEKKDLQKTLKNRTKGIDVLDFLDCNGKVVLEDWAIKAKQQITDTTKKCILIIFQRDGKKPCVLMEYSNFADFTSIFGGVVGFLLINPKYVIITLERFKEWIDVDLLNQYVLCVRKLKLKQ